MIEAAEGTSADPRSLWQRIADFPLVAMLIAIVLLTIGITVAYLIASALPPIRGVGMEVKFDLVAIPVILLIYKLVIVRLGEHPRDDLRAGGAMRRLGLGLLGGFLIFSLVVGAAAALGVYTITGQGDLRGLPTALVTSALFPGISEEIVFRGILFRWIEEFAGSWVALILTSALFGAGHLMNPNASPIAAVGIAFEVA